MGRCRYWQGDKLIAEWNSSTDPCPPEAKLWAPTNNTRCPWSGYTCNRQDVNYACGAMPTDMTLKRFKPPFWMVVSWPDLPWKPTQQLSFLDKPQRKRSPGWCGAFHCREGASRAIQQSYDLGYIDVRVFEVTKTPRRRWHLEQTMFCGG